MADGRQGREDGYRTQSSNSAAVFPGMCRLGHLMFHIFQQHSYRHRTIEYRPTDDL